ncbi:hypothetical protein ACRQ5D_33865 [Mucilaginibacter sp. P25]|uniref:hypothetical protein n=1 Tax=Mucilaginibacter sp. P25 TaxID=3423945 RepID=UPI003D7BA5FD
MKNKNLDPMAVLEWENFEWPLTVSGLKCLDGIYELPPDCQLTITRNDSYKLTGRLSGQIFDRASIAYKGGGENEPVPGEFMETERVQARKTSREEVLLTGVVLGAHQIRGLIAKPGTSYSFEAAVRLTGIEFTGPDYAEDRTEKLLEFYLCGQTHLHWPRGTERKEVTKIAKVRSGVDEEINEPVQTCRQLGGISNDYLLINTLTHYIFVQEVDKSYLPEWSKGIQIEYRRKDAPIPVEEERKAISELVGFLIGSQLLKIGESHLDDSDIVIKKNAYSPWGDNVISRCSSQSRPPVSIGYYEDWGKIEILINQLLPAYLEKREAYHLTDVLWKSWIARELPIGTNLPVLSSGLETLAESYVKSNGLNREYNKEEKSITGIW